MVAGRSERRGRVLGEFDARGAVWESVVVADHRRVRRWGGNCDRLQHADRLQLDCGNEPFPSGFRAGWEWQGELGSRGRQRLGEELMKRAFDQLAQPLRRKDRAGCYWRKPRCFEPRKDQWASSETEASSKNSSPQIGNEANAPRCTEEGGFVLKQQYWAGCLPSETGWMPILRTPDGRSLRY